MNILKEHEFWISQPYNLLVLCIYFLTTEGGNGVGRRRGYVLYPLLACNRQNMLLHDMLPLSKIVLIVSEFICNSPGSIRKDASLLQTNFFYFSFL